MKPYYPVFTEWIYKQEHLIYCFLKLYYKYFSLHFPINMLILKILEYKSIGHTNIRIYFINKNWISSLWFFRFLFLSGTEVKNMSMDECILKSLGSIFYIFSADRNWQMKTFLSLYKAVLLQGMRKIEPCIFEKSQLISSLMLCSVLLCHPPLLLIFCSSKDLRTCWAWKLPLWQVHMRRCYIQAMSHSQLLHFSNYNNLAEIPI